MVAWNENRYSQFCGNLLNILEDKGGTSKTCKYVATIRNFERKWDNIVMDLVTHFPQFVRAHDVI